MPGLDETERALLNDAAFVAAAEALALAPNTTGLYAIRVRTFDALPEPYRAHAEQRGSRVIYIGKAERRPLRQRLSEELRAKGHGTLVRSLGAVLGYRPPAGSLVGKTNQVNYTFARADKKAIVGWIDANLEVSWVTVSESDVIPETEKSLIQRHTPILNIKDNPQHLPELDAVRDLCRQIAASHL